MASDILTLNAGSSSLKFSLWHSGTGIDLRELFRGQVEKIGIAPHLCAWRPGGDAISDSALIAIAISHGRDASVHCDGQAHFGLSEGDRVSLRRAEHRARFLHPEDHDYFAMLREKLHWSETPERIRSQH